MTRSRRSTSGAADGNREGFERRETEGLRPATLDHLRWALTEHLLPHFAAFALDAITIAEVDRYVQAKARKGTMAASSINRTVSVLGSVLETECEYELIARNPAHGRRRRLVAARPARSWLRTPPSTSPRSWTPPASSTRPLARATANAVR